MMFKTFYTFCLHRISSIRKNLVKCIAEFLLLFPDGPFSLLARLERSAESQVEGTSIAEKQFPRGLTVRIAGFHPAGPGSTPGVGTYCLQRIFIIIAWIS
jgi:hypothetical protein